MVMLLLGAVAPSLMELGSLMLPLVLGAAAIYLLLPRPVPFPTWWGAGLGTLALVAAGVLWVRPGGQIIENIIFYAFSFIAVVSGTLLISQHNPARAALSFALVILSTCGLFLMLAAPFLMAATIIVYAGAIVVTFLFVLMLAQQAGLSDADMRSREPLFSVVAGFALLGGILYVLHLNYDTEPLDQILARVQLAEHQSNTDDMDAIVKDSKNDLLMQLKVLLRAHGMKTLHADIENTIVWPTAGDGDDKASQLERRREQLAKLKDIVVQARSALARGVPQIQPHASHLEKMSSFSGPSAAVPADELRRDKVSGLPQLPADNAGYLGRSLFTDYLLAVELGGILLLVAVIGAIAIARRQGSVQEKGV